MKTKKSNIRWGTLVDFLLEKLFSVGVPWMLKTIAYVWFFKLVWKVLP
jgi:hypothetical protein